jgi:hypothetical protein
MIFPPYLKNIKYSGRYSLSDYGDVPYVSGKVYVFKIVLKYPLTYINTEGDGSGTEENFVQLYMHSVAGVLELFAAGPIGYNTHTARLKNTGLNRPGSTWRNTVEGWTIDYISYINGAVLLDIQLS